MQSNKHRFAVRSTWSRTCILINLSCCSATFKQPACREHFHKPSLQHLCDSVYLLQAGMRSLGQVKAACASWSLQEESLPEVTVKDDASQGESFAHSLCKQESLGSVLLPSMSGGRTGQGCGEGDLASGCTVPLRSHQSCTDQPCQKQELTRPEAKFLLIPVATEALESSYKAGGEPTSPIPCLSLCCSAAFLLSKHISLAI